MASDYATLADLKAHWPGLPTEDEAEATQKLHEASIEVRGNYPDVDQRITVPVVDGGMDPEVPKLVVCRMVKRALNVQSEALTTGMQQVQFGAGPFTMGGTVHNPDGNIYMSSSDKRLLAKSKPRKQAWTIPVGG